MTVEHLKISAGNPLIPGVTKVERGYNFTIEADEDAKVELVLYQKKTREPVCEIPLKHELRMGRVRSVRVEGITPTMYEYNYRINGGIYHDPRAMLVFGREVFGAAAPDPEDEHAIRSGMFYPEAYDWEEDAPLHIPYEDLILYKIHVRGYTMAYRGRLSHKGTFAALKKMIPYWQELGINGIELMPAYEFAETLPKVPNEGMVTRKLDTERVNYWGYCSGFYFAPKKSYCAEKKPENEVRDFIKALHKAGIECIMEFYFPGGTDASYALKALQWWKVVYHVDGFHIIGEGAPLDLILKDGLLSETKLMAAGYDFAKIQGRSKRTLGEYQNSFQQDMRRFLKSDEEMVGPAIRHIRENASSHGVIHYMASQDGFTLRDLVTYNYRHNEDNGQENQDGPSYNYSWNCGVEGTTRRIAVKQRREQQIRNALFLLLLSQGTPMLYGGDEFGNTQNGNNNAWCQDNPVGWINWREYKKNEKLVGFVEQAIAFRKNHPILHFGQELKGTDYKAMGFPDFSLHGERAWYISYDNTSRMFGIMYNEAYAKGVSGTRAKEAGDFLYVAYNFHWESRKFALPTLPKGLKWKKEADTSLGFDECFTPSQEQFEKYVEAAPRSIVILSGEEEHQ